MDAPASSAPSLVTGIKLIVELASVLFGMLGTWRMSRRYAQELWRSLLYAATWPFLSLFGQGKRVERFFEAKASVNRDVPDSVGDMVLGLNLLFWAFFLQMVALFFEICN